MLRRSAYRAFSAGEGEAAAPVEPAPPAGRRESVRRFFGELREEIARRAGGDRISRTRLPRAPELEGESPAGEAGAEESRPSVRGERWSVGSQRTGLEGIEFVLETARGSYRFVDALAGTILVYFTDEGGSQLRDVLGVRRDPAGYRPLRKRILPRRTGFSLTSVRALADLYLGEGGDEEQG
ncbi:MAG: hypothetical protein JXA90_12530 [Planctomycetes bacterium]|nr:hypothetical protein [Planctomycetota bacterium]